MKINELLKTQTVILAGIVVLLYIPAAASGSPRWAMWATLAILLWLVCAFGLVFAYFPPKKKKRLAKVAVIKEPPPSAPETNREIATDKSLYIRPNAKFEQVTLEGKPTRIYPFDALQFDFYRRPHTLLVGESGSGKTRALFSLIGIIQAQYPQARFVPIDYGNQDFTISYKTDLETFLNVTDDMWCIMRGRQLEGKTKRVRIIWLVEEFEAVLGEIKLLPKDRRDLTTARLAQIGRMARKLDMNMIFVVQSGKADAFDTALRNNFSNRFIMRAPKVLANGVWDCPLDMGNAPTGTAWSSVTNTLVQFQNAPEPPMEVIEQSDLRRLAGIYRRQFQLDG